MDEEAGREAGDAAAAVFVDLFVVLVGGAAAAAAACPSCPSSTSLNRFLDTRPLRVDVVIKLALLLLSVLPVLPRAMAMAAAANCSAAMAAGEL